MKQAQPSSGQKKGVHLKRDSWNTTAVAQKRPGCPSLEGHGFRCLKPLWHMLSCLKWIPNSQKNIPALFLHIQKTAGTSLIEVARYHYGNSLISHGDFIGHAPEEFKDVRFVSGHIGYDFARHLMPGRFTFTFLRDPMERVLSLYYFCKKQNPNEFLIYKLANKLDLLGFLEAGFTNSWIKMHIWNNQVWQLAHGYYNYGPLDDTTINDFPEEELLRLAKEHLGEFSYIGFTETMERDGLAILSALDITHISAIPKVNITWARPNASELALNIKALLEELTFLDRQLYDYAWKMYVSERGLLSVK